MQGFMLEEFLFEGDYITGMTTWVGTYEENVYTSHILEYELFEEYEKYKKAKKRNNINCIDSKCLKYRNEIHKDLDKKTVLTTGINRASLLGVQLLIVFLDKDTHQYQVLVIKRSDDVAAKPGFYQFVPSGGFEVFENSEEHNQRELEENYNVRWAIYREYIEELISGNNADYEYGHGGETLAKIKNGAAVQELERYIDEEKAQFVFLGSVIDLCGLRNELSFVIKIDDVNYSNKIFQSNSESKKINRIPISDIDHAIEASKINPSSAALWHLFKESDLYKECMRDNQASLDYSQAPSKK